MNHRFRHGADYSFFNSGGIIFRLGTLIPRILRCGMLKCPYPIQHEQLPHKSIVGGVPEGRHLNSTIISKALFLIGIILAATGVLSPPLVA